MISQTFDLEQFVESIRGIDYYETIYAAEREATAAERLSIRLRKDKEADANISQSYADLLKGLINFLRYGIMPPCIENHHYTLFEILCKEMSQKDSIIPRSGEPRLQ
jgi:hypothetical protein